MSTQNLYVSEKDQDYKKRKIITFQGDDIGFKIVHGNRKDVIDMKLNREHVIDNMEKKMRFNDIVKQYNLFFNKKLKVYDKKYINDLVDLLDNNDFDYSKKRKLIEFNKKIRLFHNSNENLSKNYLKTIEPKNNIKNYFNQTSKNFKFNSKLKKSIRLIKRQESFKRVLSENEIKEEEINSLEIQKIKSHNDLLYSPTINNKLNEKNLESNKKEKRYYVSKISKKKTLSNLDAQNLIFSFEKKSERMETLDSYKRRYLSYLSDSNLRMNVNNNNKYNSSYFDESLKEKSYVLKKFRREKLIPLGCRIRTIDIIKSKPLIFQKPFSMLGEFYKRYKYY